MAAAPRNCHAALRGAGRAAGPPLKGSVRGTLVRAPWPQPPVIVMLLCAEQSRHQGCRCGPLLGALVRSWCATPLSLSCYSARCGLGTRGHPQRGPLGEGPCLVFSYANPLLGAECKTDWAPGQLLRGVCLRAMVQAGKAQLPQRARTVRLSSGLHVQLGTWATAEGSVGAAVKAEVAWIFTHSLQTVCSAASLCMYAAP